MKKYCIVLYLSLCCMMLSGCDKKVWYEIGTSPGWIAEYYSISKYFLGPQYGFKPRPASMNIDNGKLNITNITRGTQYASAQNYIKSGDQKYYDLCVKYGDLKPGGFLYRALYDPKETDYMGNYAAESAFAETISGIDITTAYFWDTEHPAGSSLNDIFDIKYATFYPFVQGGWSAKNPRTVVEKPLSELCEDDLKMVSTEGITLSTSVLPPYVEDCYLTVTLTLDTGETVKIAAE